jgi:hypothetical protein
VWPLQKRGFDNHWRLIDAGAYATLRSPKGVIAALGFLTSVVRTGPEDGHSTSP